MLTPKHRNRFRLFAGDSSLPGVLLVRVLIIIAICLPLLAVPSKIARFLVYSNLTQPLQVPNIAKLVLHHNAVLDRNTKAYIYVLLPEMLRSERIEVMHFGRPKIKGNKSPMQIWFYAI
jgi:hypothetical protein